jgi:hypothetical protein
MVKPAVGTIDRNRHIMDSLEAMDLEKRPSEGSQDVYAVLCPP